MDEPLEPGEIQTAIEELLAEGRIEIVGERGGRPVYRLVVLTEEFQAPAP